MRSDIKEIRSDILLSIDGNLKHGFVYSSKKGMCTDITEVSSDFEKVFALKQVHGNRVIVLDENVPSDAVFEADAMVTSLKGVCLGIYTADCVPILMYARKIGVVGAVHAGWRGTYSQVTDNTIKTLVEFFSVDTEDIIAVIGPSIRSCCYEVGEDVASKFRERFCDHRKFMFSRASGWYVDLVEANISQLKECGVREIEVLNLCTCCSEALPSYRREGPAAGRILAYIGFV